MEDISAVILLTIKQRLKADAKPGSLLFPKHLQHLALHQKISKQQHLDLEKVLPFFSLFFIYSWDVLFLIDDQ